MDEMAIFKANFIPKTAKVNRAAKDYIRYIQNRLGRDGAKIQRTIFGIDGKMERLEAYRMVDEADQRSVIYRIILNFDAEKEDTHKDIYLQDCAEQTMIGIGNIVGQQVQWVASLHDDHTPLRHVHILAILPRKLRKHELPHIRGIATEAALDQRRQRDKASEHTREPEESREEGKVREREKSK